MKLIFDNRMTTYNVKDSDYEIWVKQTANSDTPFELFVSHKDDIELKLVRKFKTKKDLSGYIWSIDNGYRSPEKLWNGEDL